MRLAVQFPLFILVPALVAALATTTGQRADALVSTSSLVAQESAATCREAKDALDRANAANDAQDMDTAVADYRLAVEDYDLCQDRSQDSTLDDVYEAQAVEMLALIAIDDPSVGNVAAFVSEINADLIKPCEYRQRDLETNLQLLATLFGYRRYLLQYNGADATLINNCLNLQTSR